MYTVQYIPLSVGLGLNIAVQLTWNIKLLGQFIISGKKNIYIFFKKNGTFITTINPL